MILNNLSLMLPYFVTFDVGVLLLKISTPKFPVNSSMIFSLFSVLFLHYLLFYLPPIASYMSKKN